MAISKHSESNLYSACDHVVVTVSRVLHLVRGVARCLNLVRSIELGIFKGKGLEVALAGQTAIRQACVPVVLISHVHLCGVCGYSASAAWTTKRTRVTRWREPEVLR